MGLEIGATEFTDRDFQEFMERLRHESRILTEWFDNGSLDPAGGVCGFELEAWLLDKQYLPAPVNEEFLQRVDSPLVVAELSKFNFEINSTPHAVAGPLLSHLEEELIDVWDRCSKHADAMGTRILAIGILPNIRDEMLTPNNMSSLRRYHALNREVLRLRSGKPLVLNIQGREKLYAEHWDVMLEAVTTSLQIHLQVAANDAVRHYNAAHIVSAPMVAVAANSPYLFGRDLWDETRIPTFEQSVSIASFRDRRGESVGRVTFGTGYGKHSILEPFLENLGAFPVLLPMVVDDDPEWLSHLRLHNGTIWRWNRPLVGMNPRGKPHIRIEHRVAAAGPSIADTVANIAFFLGLTRHLVDREVPPESQLAHEDARANFYRGAKHGLDATIKWLDGKYYRLRDLILETLIPAAREGLVKWGLTDNDIERTLDRIIEPRVRSGQNGAAWQRSFIAAHGKDFQEMTHIYYENQNRNIPVHEWKL